MILDHEHIMYNGIVTVVQEHETLTRMDDETRQALAKAADNYVHGPDRLKAQIVAAGRKGDKPADIARAIGYAYTYDYVADLVRKDRKARDAAAKS